MANYTTNLILRTDKRNTKGEQPVLLTISVSNQLKKLSTGISVHPVLWDVEEKKVLYVSSRDAKKAFKEYPLFDPKTLPLANDVKRLNDATTRNQKNN